MRAEFKYVSDSGTVKTGEIQLADYALAQRFGMSLAGMVNKKYPDADPRYGSAFQQGQKSVGIYVKPDTGRGIMASTVQDIMDGNVADIQSQMVGEGLRGTGIVSGSRQGDTPASRIFFPETVMQLMNEKLTEDYTEELRIWSNMVSATEVIASEQFTQPQIDVTAPRSERSTPIAQNTLPRNLISITSSQYTKSIITNSIGLQISEQAQARASVDLVTTILTQQSQGERFARLWEDIGYIFNGNVDAAQAALSTKAATDYDAAATGGVMTQKAWLLALYDPTRKVSYDSIICGINEFLAIQNRTGRPLVYDPSTTGPNVGALGSYGLNVEPNLLNWSVGVPNVMIIPDGIIAANTLGMFDSRYAMRRVINSSANFSATEKMVLQRSDMFRFDTGELTYRLMDEAFQWLDFS